MCVVDYLASSVTSATFAFHKVVRQHYSDEVGEFIIFWCEIYAEYRTPKLLKFMQFLPSYSKYKNGDFLDTVYTDTATVSV